MQVPGGPVYHPFDRASRDAWRDSVVDVVEVLAGRRLPAGATPLPGELEAGFLEADGLVADEDGVLVHVEFQSRADPDLGPRMARYWTALVKDRNSPAPDQHVVLLHPSTDRPGIGRYAHGNLTLSFAVHRLWEVGADALFSRPGLLRFAPLCKAATEAERLRLTERAARAMREQLAPDPATQAAQWMAYLATLYLKHADVAAIMERSGMPIDLSQSRLAIESREEGREEGLERGRRDTLRRVTATRFGDDALAARAASVPAELLDEVLDLAATAGAAQLTEWLGSHGA